MSNLPTLVFKLVFIFIIVFSGSSQAQNEDQLPYYEIPESSEEFTAGTMAARMIDALGFRYYWASDSLKKEDLVYKANEEGRSTEETLKHIYDLSQIIVNSTLKLPNANGNKEELSYKEMRTKTLTNLKRASDVLKDSDDISQYKIIFGAQEIPFWNQVNGPIADAIWHCGQLAIYRRSTGNPINPRVNHFMGKVRN